jgi:prepilin-type N-terminal cleavage/methylation domain-containing protein
MEEREEGFTLIELLVVIIIIGILAAIAIPVFLNQRKKGVDASIKSDLRTIANEEETLATDGTPYATDMSSVKTTKNGNTFQVAVTSDGNGYCIRGENGNSTGGATSYYWYDSEAGGLNSTKGASAPSGSVACAGTPTWGTAFSQS